MTKAEFESDVNELDVPFADRRSNGGRIPDTAKYGTWLRKHDPIAFRVAYRERVSDLEFQASQRMRSACHPCESS